MKTTKKGLGLAILALTIAYTPAYAAGIFVSTGHTGAQVQTDINHTQHWTITPDGDIVIDGANFTMKDGSQTSADISFAIYNGVWDANFLSTAAVASVTLTSADFALAHADSPTNQFDWTLFRFATAAALTANQEYTGVLYSNAIDSQNKAYFIKGGSTSTLSFVDDAGNSITPTVPDPQSVPEPSTLALFMVAGLLVSGVKTAKRRNTVA